MIADDTTTVVPVRAALVRSDRFLDECASFGGQVALRLLQRAVEIAIRRRAPRKNGLGAPRTSLRFCLGRVAQRANLRGHENRRRLLISALPALLAVGFRHILPVFRKPLA